LSNIITRIANAFRAGFRNFDAAGASGRWPDAASLWAQNSQSLQQRGVITRRSNYLAHNSPTGASFVESWVTNLVGDGPTIKSSHPDLDVAKQLEKSFAEWAQHADIEGVDSFTGMLQTAVRSIVASGEAVFHFPVDGYGNLKLRLLASEQLDSTRNVPSLGMTGDLPRIISGVETDAQGRRTGYWLLHDAPDQIWAQILPSERVDAVDVAHIFVRRFPGQIRGISWLTPIATRLLELDWLEDAALMKARVSALFAAFVTDPDGSTGVFNNTTAGAVGSDTQFNPASVVFEPGTLQFLPPNCDIKFPPVADMSTVTELMRHMLRSIAAGGGMSYESLTGDLSQTNFSSARLGQSLQQRRIKGLQSTLLTSQLLLPVWRRWVLMEILTGRISAPDFEQRPLDYLNMKALWPGWAAIDPLKQSKADALDLASRTKSRDQIIAENSGRDITDVDSEIENDPLFVSDPTAAAALLAQPEEVQNAAG
jgi:lambda family phage portal protein